MVGKIGFILSLLAAIVNYSTNRLLYFWLSVATAVTILLSGYMSSYIVSRPHIKKYKESVSQLEQEGSTNEEIEAFMDHPMNNGAFNKNVVPTWISIITLLAIMSGLILLILGIIDRAVS